MGWALLVVTTRQHHPQQVIPYIPYIPDKFALVLEKQEQAKSRKTHGSLSKTAPPVRPIGRSAGTEDKPVRYLCLIYLDESQLAALPAKDMDVLNQRHLQYNEELLDRGVFIEAEALQPAADTTCVRVRNGKASLTDGPYAETKEMVAGFYLIEARDLNDAIQVASRLPAAPLGVVEVRPCRDLEVAGVPHKASRKTRVTN